MPRKLSAPLTAIAHHAWRLLPPIGRRRALAQAGAWLAPRPDTPPPMVSHGLAVAGELTCASGLGESARLMLRAAQLLCLPVWPVNVPPLIEMMTPLAIPGGLPPPSVPLLLHINAPHLPLAALRMPRAMLRGRYVVGYWAWEVPTVPPDWRVGVPFVHQVWVPSRFTADALEPLMPGRIRVVPLPLAAIPPVPAALDRAAFGLPTKAVVVLSSFNLASSFARKNPLGAIAAFREAFGDRLDRLLVLKVGNPDHFPKDFACLTEAAQGANIRLETRELSTADCHALTAAADIVLSLHRSEGFGLIPAEAMLLGKPVVATGWSGNMEFMDDTSAALVEYRLIRTDDPRQVYYNSVWAEPDIASAAAHLRRLADDVAARHSLGGRAKKVAQKHLGLGPLVDAMRGIGLHI